MKFYFASHSESKRETTTFKLPPVYLAEGKRVEMNFYEYYCGAFRFVYSTIEDQRPSIAHTRGLDRALMTTTTTKPITTQKLK